MPVTLDFQANAETLVRDIDRIVSGLEGMAEAYDKVSDQADAATRGVGRTAQSATRNTGKATAALNKQTSVLGALEKYYERLERGQKKAADPALIRAYNTELAKTRAALQAVGQAGPKSLGKVDAAAKASRVGFASLGKTIRATFLPLLAISTLADGIRELSAGVLSYEQAAADLSSLTGATGDALEYLKQRSVELGVASTSSAASVLKGYGLIASAKPELLGNAEALALFTERTVTLADAMGGDLPTAAQNLTDIMNQFSAPAEDAARYVNTLAAGSKEGSASIAELAQAMLVAGTEARASGLSIETATAALETMAEKGKKGAEAGTALRNVLGKLNATEVLPKNAVDRLQAAGVNMERVADPTLALTERLRELTPVMGDANTLTAVFGVESKTAASILLQNVERIDELTRAVTDTNTAAEQAATRTRTVRGEYAKLVATISTLTATAGENLSSPAASALRFLRQLLLGVRDVVTDIQAYIAPITSEIARFSEIIRTVTRRQRGAADEGERWSRMLQAAAVPIKIVSGLIARMVRLLTAVASGFVLAAQRGGVMGRVFDVLRRVASDFARAWLDLPAIIDGSISAVGAFATRAAATVRELASKVGNLLGEAFDIRKILVFGTGDLKKAMSDIVSTDFAAAGDEARAAFAEGFRKSKHILEVPATVKVEDSAVSLDVPDVPASEVSVPATASIDAEKAAKEAARHQREIEAARIEAMMEGADKQLALEELRHSDLIDKLEKYNIDTAQAVRQHELNKLAIRQDFIAKTADAIGLAGRKRAEYIYNATLEEVEATRRALSELSPSGELAPDQYRQIAALRRKAFEQYTRDLSEYNTRELQQAEKQKILLLELERDNFKTFEDFERFKQNKILDIRLEYAKRQLEVVRQTNEANSIEELALIETINRIESEIDSVKSSNSGDGDFSLWSLLGLSEDDAQDARTIKGIETAASTSVDLIRQASQARIEAANAAVEAHTREINSLDRLIAEKEKVLSRERELAEQGLANDADATAQKIAELRERRKTEAAERKKALAEQRKAQKQQALIDLAARSSSLITAAANIYKSVSGIPFVGHVIAAGLIAVMLRQFLSFKAQASRAVQARRGMTGRLGGERHANGGTMFAHGIEAERGEDFAILSRGASKLYGSDFRALADAINDGDRKGMRDVAAKIAGRDLEHGVRITRRTEKRRGSPELLAELRRNNTLLDRILGEHRQSRKSETSSVLPDGSILIRKGSSTRIIKP